MPFTPKNTKLPQHDIKSPEGNWGEIKNWVVAHEKGMSDGGVVPTDPGVPGLPGVPEMPGVPRKKTPPPGYASGGIVDVLAALINKNAPIRHDINEGSRADAIDPMVDASTQTAHGYADGGNVPSADGAVDLSQLPGANAPQAPMQAPLAPVSAPVAPPMAPSPAGPNVASILQGGAPARQALAAQLAQRTTGDKLALLGGGIGDAIVRASGKGQSDYANTILGQENRRENVGLENFDKSAALGKEQYSLQQEVDAKDPNSKLSKIDQAAATPTFVKLGFKPEDVAKMPSSLIMEFAKTNVDLQKAISEARLAAASLGIKGEEAKSNVIHQRNEEKNAETARVQEAAKVIANRSVPQRIADFFTSNPGTETLAAQLPGAQAPAPLAQVVHVTSQQDYDALPAGTKYVDSSGHQKIKGNRG